MKNIIKVIYRNQNTNAASIIMRLLLGILFIVAGWMKLQDMGATVQGFAGMGFAPYHAYLVAWVELLGGVLLVLGLFLKPVCVALGVVMAVIVWGTPGQSYNTFFGHDYQFVLLVTLVALYFNGAGKYSVLSLRKKNSN